MGLRNAKSGEDCRAIRELFQSAGERLIASPYICGLMCKRLQTNVAGKDGEMRYGIPPYTYRWMKGGAPTTDIPGHITGATTDALTITNATSADDGEYTVDVTNAFGTIISSVAAITIDPLRANVKMFVCVIQAAVGKTVWVEYSNDLSPGTGRTGNGLGQ